VNKKDFDDLRNDMENGKINTDYQHLLGRRPENRDGGQLMAPPLPDMSAKMSG